MGTINHPFTRSFIQCSFKLDWGSYLISLYANHHAMIQTDEASVHSLDCSHQSSKSIRKWRSWWMGRIWICVHYTDDVTSNVWRRAPTTTSPPEEPMLPQKQLFCFWLSATPLHSSHLLQICSRLSSDVSTLLFLQG